MTLAELVEALSHPSPGYLRTGATGVSVGPETCTTAESKDSMIRQVIVPVVLAAILLAGCTVLTEEAQIGS